MNSEEPRKVKIAKTLQYIWQFYRPVKWQFLLSNFFSGVTVLLGFFIIPIFLKEFFDLIFEFSGKNRSELLPQLLEIVLNIFWLNVIVFWVFARIGEFLLCSYVAKSIKASESFVFSRLIEYSPAFFANHFVGSLTSKFGRLVRAVQVINDLFYFNFWPNVLRLLAAVGVIYYFTPLIAFVLTIWIVFFLGIIFWLVRKFRLPRDLKVAAYESKISGKNADVFSNILPIKMFARQRFENNFFGETVERLFLARRSAWFTWAKLNIFQSVMVTFLELFTLYLMAHMWVDGTISVGTIILIQSFLLQIYINLWTFGSDIQNFFRNMADADEMIEILETPIGIKDRKRPQKCKISKGEIVFQKVGFAYHKKASVFKNFDLEIKTGERIGIVGESGAGKSTFVNMLLRFMDISAGKILIDGQDISQITQNDLRENIAYVPQEPILFHRGLFENIKYGDLEASDQAVYQAAKKAHAFEFIEKTSEKWETLVGERGVKLSGGEKQRIAIARAILKKSPILILDEATSALDSHAEKLIQSALDNLMQNRTTIVVAHRLSTLKKMDRILVFDQGKIIEAGSHTELLKNKFGKYAALWDHQVGGFIE